MSRISKPSRRATEFLVAADGVLRRVEAAAEQRVPHSQRERRTKQQSHWPWVDWFNMRQLLGPIENVPPAEYGRGTMLEPRWPEPAGWVGA